MNSTPAKWSRIFLGVFLIIYALNMFFHFIPAGYGSMPEEARVFIDAVVAYLPFLYMFEILIGILLVFNKWTSLILIALFPLSVAFLIFNFANWDFREFWPALVVAFLNIYLLIGRKEKYMPLFD